MPSAWRCQPADSLNVPFDKSLGMSIFQTPQLHVHMHNIVCIVCYINDRCHVQQVTCGEINCHKTDGRMENTGCLLFNYFDTDGDLIIDWYEMKARFDEWTSEDGKLGNRLVGKRMRMRMADCQSMDYIDICGVNDESDIARAGLGPSWQGLSQISLCPNACLQCRLNCILQLMVVALNGYRGMLYVHVQAAGG